MSQLRQRRVRPHERQWMAPEMPRRLRRRIARPPRSSTAGELGEQRRRERIARLAAQIDDAHGRQRRADPRRQLEPLEPRPALDARRRAPVDGDGALERRPLGRDGACVVARIRLLLEGRVVLLVDDDQPEARTGAKIAERAPTTTRASPVAIRSRSSRRSASLSAGVEHGDASPNRAPKRPTVCGVSAISGTSTIAPRPRSRAAAHAWR